MKRFLVIISILTLISCKKEKQETAGKKEIPEALQDKKIFRGSSRGDLVDELYQDLVSKSVELQQLESEIGNLTVSETEEEFNEYNNKSISYYASAKFQAKSIKDSITRNKMLEILEKSNNNYLEKTKELNNLTKIIENKFASIHDSHTVLKIVLTTPIIVKYQNENLPKKKALENMIKREDSLVEKIHKQTPK